MSRIGKQPIIITKGVDVTVKNNMVTVKGPKGQLNQYVDPAIKVAVNDGIINLSIETNQKRHKSMFGLYRALIANMVQGVTQGYTSEQELIGVGYRATNQGQLLDLVLGYSHHVVFDLPKEITVTTKTERGQPPKIILESADKQLLGLVAAKIRSLRKPEPYKGKGIKFKGEILRRKAGKSAAKS
jgi:large subunit ribosomal protein L6